jgi:Fic family protein
MSQEEFVAVDSKLDSLHQLANAKPRTSEDFEKKFELSWLYHDNALEGVVLSATELSQAIVGGQVSDSTMSAVYLEVKNHRDAIHVIRQEAANGKAKISLTLVKKLYETLGAGVAGKDKAIYRRDMPLHRNYFHDIAPPGKVAEQLQKLMDFANTSEFKEYHPLKQAAVLHYGFMQVFPFTENSGKVARLLMNLLLLRAQYLPALIHSIDRQRYYETLRQPNTALRALVIEAEENSLDNAIKFFRESRESPARARASRH